MTYRQLVVEPIGQREACNDAERRADYDSVLAYADGLQAQGVLLGTQPLTPQASSARVQARGGQTQVIDARFAKAKETVGGFFLLNCATRHEAVAPAQQCPDVQWATVWMRELGPCFL